MALTIDATVGGSAANAFVTEAEQIAYMATRLNATSWTTVTGATCTETEKAAMIEAAREFSTLAWYGLRVTSTQALDWPRQDVIDPTSPNGDVFATTVVPQAVKNGAMELAFQMVKAGTTDVVAADATAGVIRKVVGPLETEYAAPSLRAQGLARYPSVMRFLRGLLAPTGSGAMRVVRA